MKTSKRIFRARTALFATLVSATAFLGACNDDDDGGGGILTPGRTDSTAAGAQVRGYSDSTLRGTVDFVQFGDSITVSAAISGLQAGKAYAIHVHEFGNCAVPESSGGHFNTGEPHGDPYDSLPAHHRGDLPNLLVGAAGIGQMSFSTTAMSLDSADNASIVGRSVVVHMDPDDYVTQPAGNSGERIACGVITLANGTDTTGTAADTTGAGQDTTGSGGNTDVKPGYP